MENTKCKNFYDFVTYKEIKFYWVWDEEEYVIRTTFFRGNISYKIQFRKNLKLREVFFRYFYFKEDVSWNKYKLFPSTGFEKRVYNVVSKIPFGETLSYKRVAELSGNDRASRAVGNVMAKNPLPLIIPCHRVVRSDGGIGGFTGGIEVKRFLLRHEGVKV